MAFEIRFDVHEKGSDHILSTSALDYGMISDFQTLIPIWLNDFIANHHYPGIWGFHAHIILEYSAVVHIVSNIK